MVVGHGGGVRSVLAWGSGEVELLLPPCVKKRSEPTAAASAPTRLESGCCATAWSSSSSRIFPLPLLAHLTPHDQRAGTDGELGGDDGERRGADGRGILLLTRLSSPSPRSPHAATHALAPTGRGEGSAAARGDEGSGRRRRLGFYPKMEGEPFYR